MSLNHKQDINFKSEAWKYTPKKDFSLEDFKLHDFKEENCTVGLGPSESQFQALPFKELCKESLKPLSDSIPKPSGKDIDRALLDPVLENLLSYSEERSFSIEAPFPTTAWLNMNSLPVKFSIRVNEGQKQSFCFFESSQEAGLSNRMSFHLKQSSELTLGLDLSAEEKSYRQLVFVLEKGAKLNPFNLFSGASKYKRLELRVFQLDEESAVTINGLSLAKEGSVFDYHSDVLHLNKAQKTTQIYKSLNQDRGHSIFSGRVHLTEESSGADVEQLNNNLLLNKKSKVDTQPELNIYQDDVKASHGATTGSLDEDHFFYLRSRGFKLSQAKKMLLEGFCMEPLEVLQNYPGLSEYFKDRIAKEL